MVQAVSDQLRRWYSPLNAHNMFDSLVDAVTSMSALLTEPLDAYLSAFQWETHGNEQPYLFHPSDDTTRCLPSSQWTSVVKACFKKHSPNHVAPPPKVRSSVSYSPHARSHGHALLQLLRASFITWLRDSTDAPDVLKVRMYSRFPQPSL